MASFQFFGLSQFSGSEKLISFMHRISRNKTIHSAFTCQWNPFNGNYLYLFEDLFFKVWGGNMAPLWQLTVLVH